MESGFHYSEVGLPSIVDARLAMPLKPNHLRPLFLLGGLVVFGVMLALVLNRREVPLPESEEVAEDRQFTPRMYLDTSGFSLLTEMARWDADASLSEVAAAWDEAVTNGLGIIDQQLHAPNLPADTQLQLVATRATFLNYVSDPQAAYETLSELRRALESQPALAEQWLYTVIYFQGVTSLRQGENENCIMCRGDASCILPLRPAAFHTNRTGSERAVKHFAEYLEEFPDDVGVRWLLNVAHMTLGQYPDQVDQRFLVSLDDWQASEFEVGEFHDIGEEIGINRLNQSGGAIMDDFNNNGLLDLVVTSFDPTLQMDHYINRGDGKLTLVSDQAGVADQLGGLYCVQADYNDDGWTDVFVPRGAWQNSPMRPTLLRNEGDGTFTDATAEAGLLVPTTSNSAAWEDFDRDGYLDLFVCCELTPSRLYRNRGDGTFVDISEQAQLVVAAELYCKGATWIDYDNDDFPDLFLNHLKGTAQLWRNQRDGTFVNSTRDMHIDGPQRGFSCWSWDYDNDGWLDVFATSYDLALADIVNGLTGQPHSRSSNCLYHNEQGAGFTDVTADAGLDLVFATMGSNFGDVDNDGFLDMYLGTGDPDLGTLVPNRMFKNVAGARFADITASSRTGHLQKGHAVSFADWDRNGFLDMFVQMGGASIGDEAHNMLYENPNQGGNSCTIRFIGRACNRSAIGARITAITASGEIHRHVTTGSSFGANPLEMTIGIGANESIDELRIHWPGAGSTATFFDIPAGSRLIVDQSRQESLSMP